MVAHVAELVPDNPFQVEHVSHVLPVQVRVQTTAVPPGSGIHNCTVITRLFTIIIVFGSEVFPIVIRQGVSRCTRVRAHGQPVQRHFVAYCKLTIFGISFVPAPVL